MSEAYIYNGIYPQLISELYTGSGEAEEAYAWAGPGLTQQIYPTVVPLEGEIVDCAADPPVVSVNGDDTISRILVLEPTAPARTLLDVDGGRFEKPSGAGTDKMRLRLDKAWGDNSPWVSPLEFTNEAMGGKRLNIGKLVWPSKDNPGSVFVGHPTYVKDGPEYGSGNSRAIRFGRGCPANSENYYLPELHLFDPTPILMGTVTGKLSSSPSTPSWDDNGSTRTWRDFDTSSEAGTKVSIKTDGINALKVYIARAESDGYNDNQEWIDSLGYISVTIERPGVWPETEMVLDVFAQVVTSSQILLHRETTVAGRLRYNQGVSSEINLVPNEDIVLRVYKYLY